MNGITVAGIINPNDVAPMIMCLGMMAIPIVAILSRHQRKMTEIIHGHRNQANLEAEVQRLSSELADVKAQLRSQLGRPSVEVSSDELTRRLG